MVEMKQSEYRLRIFKAFCAGCAFTGVIGGVLAKYIFQFWGVW